MCNFGEMNRLGRNFRQILLSVHITRSSQCPNRIRSEYLLKCLCTQPPTPRLERARLTSVVRSVCARYASDAINGLQGVIIFLLFTMRERSRRIILRHLDSWGVLRWCRCCRQPSADGRAAASSNKTRTTSVPTGTSGRSCQLQELEPVMAAADTNRPAD